MIAGWGWDSVEYLLQATAKRCRPWLSLNAALAFRYLDPDHQRLARQWTSRRATSSPASDQHPDLTKDFDAGFAKPMTPASAASSGERRARPAGRPGLRAARKRSLILPRLRAHLTPAATGRKKLRRVCADAALEPTEALS